MITILFRTLLIYVILIATVRTMGKRQIGELEVNELVSTLLLSEIAAIPISDTNLPLFGAFIPIVFISCLEILVSALKNKSSRLKHTVEGEAVYIIYKGRLLKDELIKNRISINEILTEMRTQGIGSLSELYYGVLEQNGKLSLFTKNKKDSLAHSLIIDGERDEDLMSMLGVSNEWLDLELRKRGVREHETFLFTVTDSGETDIILKEEKK